MERVGDLQDWLITSRGEGVEKQEMLFTYSEEEQEENRIAKNNSQLVLNPEFIPVYPKMLQNGYSLIEATIYWFIRFFLSNNERFYCTNEQLCLMLSLGETSVSQAIKKLEKDGLIKCKYKQRSWWGKIRYIQLSKYETWSFEIQNFKFWNTKGINNKIINNNTNNTINISSPLKKIAAEAATMNPLPGPLPEEMREFIEDSYRNYPSVRYQMDKRWSNFVECNLKDRDKLKEEYGEETVKTVLRFVKQDPFRCKQIQTVGKLRKKNKDWVPYMVVMMEKIKEYKPKVLDLDKLK